MKATPILAVSLFLAAGAGALYLNATRQADVPAHVNTLPDMTGLEKGDPIVKVKLPDKLSPRAQLGKKAFDSVCAACHGVNASGRYGHGPTFISRIYVPTHHGDEAFVFAAQNGVRSHHWPFGDMPPQKGLTRADLMNIAVYIRELQRANGIIK